MSLQASIFSRPRELNDRTVFSDRRTLATSVSRSEFTSENSLGKHQLLHFMSYIEEKCLLINKSQVQVIRYTSFNKIIFYSQTVMFLTSLKKIGQYNEQHFNGS